MFELSNLRIETMDGWAKVICDVCITGSLNIFDESQMWFAVKSENAYMLSSEVYDPFFLVSLYASMYMKTDLKINGKLSKKLYRNMMDYGQQILCNFSDSLRKVNVYIDGYGSPQKTQKYCGTGISCGIDSLSTIFKRFVLENDSEYRIDSLFIFNCGTFGDFEEDSTKALFLNRVEHSERAASDIGLRAYQVDSNLHAFTHIMGQEKVGYLAFWSCVICVQSALRRYYMSSANSYDEMLKYGKFLHDIDMSEYADPYLVPLIQTGNFEFVLEGAQLKRSQKTEMIADWDIARKYLTVCSIPKDGVTNCCRCSKCNRTMITFEAMGKLKYFSNVFDLEKYKAGAHRNKLYYLAHYKADAFTVDVVDYAREKGLIMPSKLEVQIFKIVEALKKYVKKVLGAKKYGEVKKLFNRAKTTG